MPGQWTSQLLKHTPINTRNSKQSPADSKHCKLHGKQTGRILRKLYETLKRLKSDEINYKFETAEPINITGLVAIAIRLLMENISEIEKFPFIGSTHQIIFNRCRILHGIIPVKGYHDQIQK